MRLFCDRPARAVTPATALVLGCWVAAGAVGANEATLRAADRDPLTTASALLNEGDAAADLSVAETSYRSVLDVLDGVPRNEASALAARAHLGLGRVYYQAGRSGDSVVAYQAAVGHAREAGEATLEADALLGAGTGQYVLGRYEDALEAVLQGLRLAEAHGLQGAVARACHVAGMIHRDTGQVREALQLFQRAAEAARAAGDQPRLVRCLNEQGNALYNLGQAQAAVERKVEALDLARGLGDESAVADVLNDLAMVAAGNDDYAAAQRYLEEAYTLTMRSGGPRERAIAALNLAGVAGSAGELARARPLVEEALTIARGAQLASEEALALATLADIEAASGNYEAAFGALRTAYDRRQEILSRDAARRVADLRAVYQAEQREAEIKLLTSEREIQSLTLYRERTARRWWIAGFVAAVAFALLLGIGLRLKVRSGAALAAANRKVEELARTDTLTGLANRRHLVERLDQELRRSERGHSSFTLVMLDLDDFKRFNDTHGHACGDAVLTHVGGVLAANVRGLDVAGRWGGEEFLLVLPGTGIEGAVNVAEKIRQIVAAAPVEWEGEQLAVTATLGVAECSDADIERCLREADDALYRGKQAGKNRVVVA